ncbi:hypothetical protein O181_029715 [Austropuccinia psidii MF-1]|uniref:Cyanovirin-N domain-containing protein n=1 Tax=Austropuccinia psidii MF-1 TaxID=1389203 RepID=A0A9Q3H5G6_9BASI|nr:hypothetical protein [Austropuccinia psidii MF-1]
MFRQLHQQILLLCVTLSPFIPFISMALDPTIPEPTTVCGKYWRNLQATGQKMGFQARLMCNEGLPNNQHSGRINASRGLKTQYVKPGTGACQIPYTNETRGACLWGGNGDQDGLTSGWVTGAARGNCNKTFIAWRGDYNATGNVVDSCSLDENLSIEEGCSTLWVTRITFQELGGNPSNNTLDITSWDFLDVPN